LMYMVTWRHLLQQTSIFGCSFDPSSKYIIVGAPLDQTVTYKPGTRFAPQRIREASCNIEFYSIFNNVSLDRVGYNDLGDIVITPGDLERVFNDIASVVRGIVEEYEEPRIFVLGGEHTITYPIVKALSDDIEHVVVFDAHTDLRDEYLGSRYNHATVFRRLYEELNIPITYIGTRAYGEEELEFIRRHRDMIRLCDIRAIYRDECKIEDYGKTYISIDMDAVDPSHAPGVSNPEPLGLTPYQLIEYLVKTLSNSREIIGVDLVEVNPLVDINDVTSILASKIIVEIIGFYEARTR
jgi:agmatinase